MERLKISLSLFEAVMHRRSQKTPLMAELEDCFKYFEEHAYGRQKHEKLSLIHATRIEIRKVGEGRGYAVEIDGGVRVVGVDAISESEKTEIIRRIQNITIPYSLYVKARAKQS